MKRSWPIIIVLSVFTILSNAVGIYLFYYSGRIENMDIMPSRLYVYICQAFSPVIFDLHRSMWGLVQPGTLEYCQLGFSGLELFVLILFLTGQRWAGWLLWSFYLVTAAVGITHLAYYVYFGIVEPFFIFPGRYMQGDIHSIGRMFAMIQRMLIISRIIWVSVSLILSWQIWKVLKSLKLSESVG